MNIDTKKPVCFYLVFIITLISRFQSFLLTPYFSDDIIVLGYIVFIFSYLFLVFLKTGRSLKVDYCIMLSFFFFLYISFYTFVINNSDFSTLVRTNFIQYFIWILFILATVEFIEYKQCYDQVIFIIYACISCFLVFQYITNFDSFKIFSNLGLIFNSDVSERYRESYGFSHPNNCGDFCLAGIVIAVLIRTRKNRISSLWLFSDAIKIVMLLSTSSRGSILGLVLFSSVFCYLISDRFFLKNIKYRRFLGVLLTIFLIIIFTVLLIAFCDFQEFLVESNRSYNFSINIPSLVYAGKLFWGVGFIPSAVFGTEFFLSNYTFVDNYYLYVLISTGLTGCIFICCIILSLILHIKKYLFKDSVFYKAIISIICMCFFISFFESELFNPAYLSSYIYMILLLSVASNSRLSPCMNDKGQKQ